MPQLLTFWTAAPTHVRVYPCPQCQETISIEAPTCRFCHAPVDGKVAEQLWVENQQIATAITRAYTFSLTSHVAVVTTGMALWFLYLYSSLREFWLIAPLLAVSYGAQWLNHNSSLVTDDPYYLKTVAKLKRTMRIWAAVPLIQVAAYLYLNGLPDWNTILELFVVG
jgi:hypothetical protein